MFFQVSVAFFLPIYRLSETFHCLLGIFRFSTAFQNSFQLPQFSKIVFVSRRYFKAFRFSVTKNVYGNLEKHEIFRGKPETDSLQPHPQYTVNGLHLHANVALPSRQFWDRRR